MAVSTFPWNQVNSLVQDIVEPMIRDQIFLSNILWFRLRNRIKYKTGGRKWVFPLNWKVEGGGGGWFAGTQTLNTMIYDTIQAAEFTPKNAYVELSIDWESEMQVAGPEQVRDLVEAKTEIARNTAIDMLATNLYNSGSDSQAMTGLQYIFKDWSSSTVMGSQTYGGITREVTGVGTGTNIWWANQGDPTAYTTGAAGTFTDNNLQALGTGFAKVKKASGKWPSLIVSNVYSFTDYHNALVKNERLQRPQQDSELGKAGFHNLMYRNAPWVADEKAPRNETTKIEKVYLLNEDSLILCADPRALISWTGWRNPHNQMARVGFFLSRLELLDVEPRSNLVMSGVDTTNIS